MHVPGTILDGRYQILGVFRSGGMGVIYQARNLYTSRVVALKRIKAPYDRDPELVARMRREGHFSGTFTHDHIIAAIDAGEDESGPFVVFDLLDGVSVAERIASDGPLVPSHAVAITLHLLDALEHVHARHVVHRDIKPGNVFLARSSSGAEVVKLIDFGAAKKVSSAGVLPAEVESTVGANAPCTIHYASPEQLNGAPDIDARSDLWAVGVMLFRMLTGSLPFPGSKLQVCAAIQAGSIPSVATLRAGLPKEFDAVIGRALTIDRSQRFQSAEEMRMSVQSIADALAERTMPGVTFPHIPHPAGGLLVEATPDTLRPIATVSRSSPSRRARWVVAILSAFTLTLGGGYWLFRSKTTATPGPTTASRPTIATHTDSSLPRQSSPTPSVGAPVPTSVSAVSIPTLPAVAVPQRSVTSVGARTTPRAGTRTPNTRDIPTGPRSTPGVPATPASPRQPQPHELLDQATN